MIWGLGKLKFWGFLGVYPRKSPNFGAGMEERISGIFTTLVHITFTDIEEYNMRSIAILDCNTHSQITVAHVTLPKAVPSTVKIFAVYI